MKRLLFFSAVILFLSGCAHSGIPKTNLSSSTNIKIPSASVITSTRKIVHNESKAGKLRYTYDAVYPVFIGGNIYVITHINNTIKGVVKQEHDNFYNNLTRITSWTSHDLDNFYFLDYAIPFQSSELVVVRFDTSEYVWGGRQNTWFTTINFDMKTGKQIKLVNLFLPHSNYINKLSDLVIQNLTSQINAVGGDTSWVIKDASPYSYNFHNFALTPKGLQFVYQRLIEGRFTVTIPYSKLQSLLDPNGPVAQFIK